MHFQRAWIFGCCGKDGAADSGCNGRARTVSTEKQGLATPPDGRALRRAKAENYLVLYVVTGDAVSVLAVIYGRSDIEERLAGLF